MSQCTDPRMEELLGAYALGACPAGEAEQLRAHLETCAFCAHALSELEPAREALLTAVPPVTASPALKDRVMRQVRADAELFEAARAREAGERPATARRARTGDGFRARMRDRLRSPVPLAAAVACGMALAVAGGVLGATLLGDDSPSPGTGRVVLGQVDSSQAPGATARIVEKGGQARIVVDGMPDPGEGRVYEVWLQTGKDLPRPTRALFSVNREGTGETAVPGTLKGVDRVMVTSEPAGGSKLPTRDPVVVVQV